MNILYITYLGITSSDYPLYLSQAWEKLGHKVELFSYDIECIHSPYNTFVNRVSQYEPNLKYQQTRKKILSKLKKNNPDLVIFSGDFFSGKLLEEIKIKYKCKVGFLLGYNNILQEQIIESIRNSDFLIIHDTYFYPILQGENYNQKKFVFYFPGMVNPEIHKTFKLDANIYKRYNYDVVFVGGVKGGKRQEYLESLTNYNMQIFGFGNSEILKPFLNPEPIYGIRKSYLYNSSRIILNIEEKQLNAINPRIPEVMACGGFILTDYSSDLDLYGFKDGESIVYFNSKEELSGKIKYYLANEKERIRIIENGRIIALQNLTFDRIAKQIADGFESLFKG